LQSAAGRERDLQSTDWSVICRECGNDLQIIGLFSCLIDRIDGYRVAFVGGGCWLLDEEGKREREREKMVVVLCLFIKIRSRSKAT
jgi:hypothetical protein